MKLEHCLKLEGNFKIKWRLITLALLAAWCIYTGEREVGISLLTGALWTKGE